MNARRVIALVSAFVCGAGAILFASILLAMLPRGAAADGGPSLLPVDGTAPSRSAELQRLMRQLANASTPVKLRGVNRFFNTLEYRSDWEAWGREDHWTTPAELLATGAGDCEDLAIAKYFTLRRLGIVASSLRITYVRDVRRDQAHMVLVHRPAGSGAIVLDSRDQRLVRLAQRPDLIPIYGFNEGQVTVSTPGGGERSFPHAGRWRIRQWQAVLQRAAAAPLVMPPADT